MLKAVRHGALRFTMSATNVAQACSTTATGSPKRRSAAKTKAVEIEMPFTSREPAVNSGRTSARMTSPTTAQKAGPSDGTRPTSSAAAARQSTASPTMVTVAT